MADVKTVKMDLRRIKYGKKHLIELSEKVKRIEEYIVYLDGCRKTKEVKLKLDANKRVLDARRKELRRKEREIEGLLDTYKFGIECLSELDRRILLEGYIEGIAYHQIGSALGYSERGIQERLVRIFEALAADV